MTRKRIDTFERVVADPGFYGPRSRYRGTVQKYQKLFNDSEICSSERLEISLALIRVQRVRLLADEKQLWDDLGTIKRQVTDEGTLRKLDIVEAEFGLHIETDFEKALLLLERLASDLAVAPQQSLYSMVAYALAVAHMGLGNNAIAEDFAQDSASIARRTRFHVLLGHSLNVQGLTKKIRCQYAEAEKLFRKALDVFANLENDEGKMFVYNNLAVAKMKMGEWRAAEIFFRQSVIHRERIEKWAGERAWLNCHANINLYNLMVLKRNFPAAEVLEEQMDIRERCTRRQFAIHREFTSDIAAGKGDLKAASKWLTEAEAIAERIAPESDVMTEVIRRRAQLALARRDTRTSHRHAIACIRLCLKIGDRHELGAVLRTLGQIHAAEGRPRKAASAFEAGIHILRSIGECYELMRNCLAYAEFLIENDNKDAEMYILEAKQLCRRLEIDFFMSQVHFLTAKYHFNNTEYVASRSALKKAEEIAESLQDCDRKQLIPKIKRFYKELEQAILQHSVKGAEKLKTLGKIYEDARFPVEELGPEMATDVGHTIGAQALFLVRRFTKGYRIPIKYNTSVEDAKRMVRMQLRNDTPDFFDITEPKVYEQTDGRVMVCVPGQSGQRYILCTVFENAAAFNPADLEYLIASVRAMEGVAEEYAPARSASLLDGEDFINEGPIRHPGGHFKNILTIDDGMIKVIQLAERASQTDVPVLFVGETGVGKELFARAVHDASNRRHKAFIAMNAGGMPLNLFESQLFGHVKGAYTDAVSDRVGLIEEAEGGTLFLDEVGEMGEELQVKLLRLLENGEYRRLGENTVKTADVRIISATNKNLEERVEEGLFREDLYYRLATVALEIPPLRNRKRDVEFLVRHFLKTGLAQIGKENAPVHVDLKALEAFEIYRWPGNVRELKNEMLRNLSLIGGGEVIRFAMLSEKIRRAFEAQEAGHPLNQRVERFERRLILRALEENDWNRKKTAGEIGIPRPTLIFKMRKLNIVR